MPEKIIELLQLDGRHTRSVALNRDLHDGNALERYVITPNSLGALRQVGAGICSRQVQRAWKIVGPYGSGKSAFGILLAQLLSGKERFPTTAQSLIALSPKTAQYFEGAKRFPIAVVGSRVSFGVAFANAVAEALTGLEKGRASQKIRKKLDVEAGTYGGAPVNAAVSDIASDLLEAVRAQGYEGLLLLIDEIGKFVEHAALYPELGDLIALQHIAEHACNAADDGLVVVAMLHQHFASYAAGVGRALGDEWHKVAARFEEIPFDEPVERYAHFASQAFGEGKAAADKQVVASARKEYAWALEKNILRAPTSADKELFKRGERLFPLHPLVLAALATISKRYGQSERSFHAFLYGGEAFAMRDFAQRTEVSENAWYRIQDLYDYLEHGHQLRFRELDVERKWVFATGVVEQHSGDVLGASLLKAIAVLELVKSSLGLQLTAEVIASAIGNQSYADVVAALTKYADQGILVKRQKNTEYGFAVSTAVNIEALYEKFARADENDLMVRGTTAALATKLVVATRHYDETGTIRTLGTVVGTIDQWPVVLSGKSDSVQADAWLKLILIAGGNDQRAVCESRFSEETDLLTLHACLSLSAEGGAALAEYAIWTSIADEVNAKSLDPWTSRYVDARVIEASENVERLVVSALTPIAGRNGPTYWHCGSPVQGSEQKNLSQIGSWLFDNVFYKAPHIVNELINKDRPSPPIVVARQRMFEVLLGGDSTRKIYGEKEYPPERLIHTTLLKQTGIWREFDGRWSLGQPDAEGTGYDISSVWNEISRVLSQPKPSTFADILDAVAAPPFGVRNGSAGIWAVLYLIVNRTRCAIFDRGSLVLELTAEILMRMYKNPQAFTARELASESESRALLSDYHEVLSAIGCQVGSESSFLEMTRILYRWFARLPEFTKNTSRISKDASLVRSALGKSTDPIALLTQTLRKAHEDSKSKLNIKLWLTQVLTELGTAHRRLQDEVASELSKGFGIAGPLSRVRAQLQSECTREATTLAEADLKSFILRCTDVALTDEKWLDSVGSLLAHRPLDSWQDDTLAKFQEHLTQLCARYRRWMKTLIQRGVAPRASERFVGLTLTMPNGKEASVFVTRNEKSDSIAKDVLALIAQSSKGDPDLAAAALAHALLELQPESPLEKKEVGNG